MIKSVSEFERLLDELNPADDEFVLQTDDLVEQLAESIAPEVYPAVFAFFEKHPAADCGAPGTLVHHVEHYYPNYVDTLLASARDKPSYNAALMLNRILNSDIPSQQRAKMLDLLTTMSQNAGLPEVVQDTAAGFLKHQNHGRD